MTEKTKAATPPPEKQKQLKPVEEIRSVIMGATMGQQLKAALPAHISVEKFQRVAVTAIMQNPRLQAVDRASLYQECVKCAQDGLIPDGREAALIDANKKVGNNWIKVARYMPMVWGIAKKIRNSGELAMLTSHVVYADDEFDYWIDDQGEHLRHKPKLTGERGEPTGVYALAKTKAGEVYLEVMTMEQVERVMAASTSRDAKGNLVGPWVDWKPEMMRKSAIRRLSKRMPMSTDKEDELRRVLERDDDLYELNRQRDMGAAVQVEATATTTTSTRPRRLQAVVDAGKAAAPTPPEPEAPEDPGEPPASHPATDEPPESAAPPGDEII